MLANVHLGKRADISNSSHFYCEVAIEVNDVQCFVPCTEYEDQWCQEGTEEFFQEIHLQKDQDQSSEAEWDANISTPDDIWSHTAWKRSWFHDPQNICCTWTGIWNEGSISLGFIPNLPSAEKYLQIEELSEINKSYRSWRLPKHEMKYSVLASKAQNNSQLETWKSSERW